MTIAKVVHYFTDKADNLKEYKVDDLYFNFDDERVKELSTKQNRQEKPLIKVLNKSELLSLAESNGIGVNPKSKVAALHEQIEGELNG